MLQAQEIAPAARKSLKITYWVSTVIFVLLDGVLPAFTFKSAKAKEGIRHLGFPDYFGVELGIGKTIGGLLLILPMIPPRYKEWAYAGYGISIISAFVGTHAVDGPVPALFFPVLGMAILLTSYISYHKIKAKKILNYF